MFVPLFLVAIFSSSLLYEAETLPTKCDPAVTEVIYSFWNENGGVPKNIVEKEVSCYERELILVSTRGLQPQEVTCSVIRHYATHQQLYHMAGDKIYNTHDSPILEYNGRIIETDRNIERFQIAEYQGARLFYVCNSTWEATVAENQFFIRAVENRWTEEGVEKMIALMGDMFNIDKHTLRTYTTTCPVPGEPPMLTDCAFGCHHENSERNYEKSTLQEW